AYACALAVPMLAGGAVLLSESWRVPTLAEAATLAYLAVMLTVVAFLAWFTGLRRLGVEKAGLYVGVLPVATLVSTSVQDRALPVPAQAAGVLIVALGLAAGLAAGHAAGPAARTSRAGPASARPG